MRLVLGGVAGVLCLALAACGGDNSSTPSPTPTPTPTGTPTPTPSPTAIAYTTSEGALQYTLEGGVQRVANAQFVAPAMGSVFAFTPDQNGYTYTLLNGTVNPSPSETAIFTPTTAKACLDMPTLCFGSGFAFQQIPAGTGTYTLSRFIAGSSNPLQVLTNTAFGLFEESFPVSTAGPLQQVDLRPFAYGVTSPAAAIPTTGTATFNGLITGQATGNKPSATGTSNLYKVTGSFTLVANYAAGTATLKLTLLGDATGCTTCSPDINVTYDATAGTLASGVFTFTMPGGGSAKFFLAGGVVADSTTTPATVAVAPTEVAGSFVLTAADPNEAAVTMVVAGAGGGLR